MGPIRHTNLDVGKFMRCFPKRSVLWAGMRAEQPDCGRSGSAVTILTRVQRDPKL